MSNTMVQSMVRTEFRGRVMSIYVLMFLGFAPFGNFEVGMLSERFSIPTTLIANAAIVLFFGLIIFSLRHSIGNAYRDYNQSNSVKQ